MTSRRLAAVLCGALLLTGPLGAQAPVNEIFESRGSLLYASKGLKLGTARPWIEKVFGPPEKAAGATLVYPGGLTLRFDLANLLERIEVRSPYRGTTEKGISIGMSSADLKRAYPALRRIANGWNRTDRIEFLVAAGRQRGAGRVTAIALTRGKKRRPDVGPPRPGEGRPQRERIPIWDKSFQISRRTGAIPAPVGKWPRDSGVLLVRVAYSDGVRNVEQRFCGYKEHDTDARDYIYKPTVVTQYARPDHPPSWEWLFRGRGQAKVQITWFRTKKLARRYIESAPYDRVFAFRREPPRRVPTIDPLLRYKRMKKDIRMVWDHSWTAHRDTRWVRGPRRGWPEKARDGVLLVRAVGGRGVRGFAWRLGNGEARQAELGDHVIPLSDVRGRGGRRSILDRVGGRRRGPRRLDFTLIGHGPGRVMVYYVPASDIVDDYCREHPRQKISYWSGEGFALEDDWQFGRGSKWRESSTWEQDWRSVRTRPRRGFVNVASPRHGAWIRRSGLDDGRTITSEYDGGLWYSDAAHVAWTESWFFCPSQIDRVCIATAGSDHHAARLIVVELLNFSNVWEQVGLLYHENINWCGVTGGRTTSRPPLVIDLTPGVYLAMRVTLTGHGPFRVGGIVAEGRGVQDPRSYDPPFGAAHAARVLDVPANAGWVDTGGLVSPGRRVFIETDGAWSIAAGQEDYHDCGAEGYASLYIARLLTGELRNNLLGRLPARGRPPGALIGRIDDGPPFRILPGRPFLPDRAGRLLLACNDANWADNRGVLRCTVVGADFSIATAGAVAPTVCVRFTGRVIDDRSGFPLPAVDVIVQTLDWPRTVYGGLRTDARGEFTFEANLPAGVRYVVCVPERRAESDPFDATADSTIDWNPRVR